MQAPPTIERPELSIILLQAFRPPMVRVSPPRPSSSADSATSSTMAMPCITCRGIPPVDEAGQPIGAAKLAGTAVTHRGQRHCPGSRGEPRKGASSVARLSTQEGRRAVVHGGVIFSLGDTDVDDPEVGSTGDRRSASRLRAPPHRSIPGSTQLRHCSLSRRLTGYRGPVRSGVFIAIPVYPGGDVIEETIRSILAQTHFDFHLVMSVDGADTPPSRSAESTPTTLGSTSWSRRTAWLAGNFNWLIENCDRGFCYWQQDDLASTGYLESLRRELLARSDAAIAYTDVQWFGARFDRNGSPSIEGDPLSRVMQHIRPSATSLSAV